MEREHLVTAAIFLVILLLMGSCVADYTSSTEQIRQATVYDKQHQPAYWSVSCSGGKRARCHPVYHPPTWAVEYEDEQGRHWEYIGHGLYDEMRAGDPVTVSFFEGGYFGFRYGTAFTLHGKSNGW
jgi:hypothetical protein